MKTGYLTLFLILLSTDNKPAVGLKNQHKPTASYSVVLPPDFNPHEKHYLVVALHAIGRNEIQFSRLLEKANADHGQFVIVCPRGNIAMGSGGYRWGYQNSDAYLINFVSDIRREFLLHDPILLFGFSNGAFQGFYTALNFPRVFSHFAGISGGASSNLTQEQRRNAKDVQLLFLSGEHETATNFDIDQALRDVRPFNSNVKRVVFPAQGHYLNKQTPAIIFDWFLKSLDSRFSAG